MVFGSNLVGVVTLPAEVTTRVGIVMLGAGRIHSIGPNRIYVTAARRIAGAGVPVLRYDAPGIGDSCLDARDFAEAMRDGIRQAITTLQEASRIDSVGLIGVCSGATMAFRAALDDDRVRGLFLANPDMTGLGPAVLEPASSAHLLRRYLRAARSSKRWIRLLSGKSKYRAIAGAAMGWVRGKRDRTHGPKHVGELVDQLDAFRRRELLIRLVLSEFDPSVDQIRQLERAIASWPRNGGAVTVLAGADHTFTLLAHQRAFLDALDRWVSALTVSEPSSPRRTDPCPATQIN